MGRSFGPLELTAVAIEDQNFKIAQREGVRSDELRSQAQERLAACLTTELGTR
jgi:hypothetical protein